MLRKMIIIALAPALLSGGAVLAQTHASWPIDWNNWNDPLLWCTIGNPGNAPDANRVYTDPDPNANPRSFEFGSVAYTFRIGRFDVTAGQYTSFLNAVAKTDPFGLYNPSMSHLEDPYDWSNAGCNIQRNGVSGNYSYNVDPNWANRPVNYVSWAAAARFCNWLTNGQPTGPEGAGTTETGSYTLNGAMDNYTLLQVNRNPGARYVIPSEDEWYKAAYYDPNKPGGAGYWDYPYRSDDEYDNHICNPDPGHNANFSGCGYTVNSPYWLSEVGEFENSASPWGTFDQGGNVYQWNEGIIAHYGSAFRCVRGGSYTFMQLAMTAEFRGFLFNGPNPPDSFNHGIGFRIAEVPLPINQVPNVNAGIEKKIMLSAGNTSMLAGSVSDDGLPNPPGVCTASWNMISGPAAVTFANPSAAITTATFYVSGTYVLQLTANDSQLNASSKVTVSVLAPGDFNGDGKVDGVDFLIWQSHYPMSSGATCDHGDANGDGKVDGVDFLIWQANYHG
jgi:formylglycine-generating enzyme required for sulfatase activity